METNGYSGRWCRRIPPDGDPYGGAGTKMLPRLTRRCWPWSYEPSRTGGAVAIDSPGPSISRLWRRPAPRRLKRDIQAALVECTTIRGACARPGLSISSRRRRGLRRHPADCRVRASGVLTLRSDGPGAGQGGSRPQNPPRGEDDIGRHRAGLSMWPRLRSPRRAARHARRSSAVASIPARAAGAPSHASTGGCPRARPPPTRRQTGQGIDHHMSRGFRLP